MNFTADRDQPLAELPHPYRTNVADPGAFLGPPMAASHGGFFLNAAGG